MRVKLQEIEGSAWEGIYNLDRIDIDNDEIGDLEKDLRRDGWAHELGVKYTLSLDKGFSLRPELSFSYGDIEGLRMAAAIHDLGKINRTAILFLLGHH